MNKYLITICILFSAQCISQDSIINTSFQESLKDTSSNIFNKDFKGNQYYEYSKKKEKFITYSQIVGYSANFASLYYFWYKDAPLGNFHFFDDNGTYLQVDKISHMFGTYTGGRISMEMWKWAGAPKQKYVWVGGLTGLGYLTVVEVMDGISPAWGFSLGDYAANVLGTALVIG